MATVPGPPTSMADVRAVFGAPAGTPLHDFYRGGPWVPNVAQNANVPTTPPIRLAQLAGATNYQPPVISGPSSVNWSGDNHRPPIAYTTPSGQSVSGGTNSYTAHWDQVSGTSGEVTCDNVNAVNGPFRANSGINPGETVTKSGVWRLSINDGVQTLTKDVTFTFTGT